MGSVNSISPEVANEITADAIMYSTENSIIIPGMTADLQNPAEGTIIWWTKPEMNIFKEFKDKGILRRVVAASGFLMACVLTKDVENGKCCQRTSCGWD